MTPDEQELHEALEQLRRARTPADLFGTDPAEAARVYRRLARILHPDASGGRTTHAFAELAGRWRAYGRPGSDAPASEGVISTRDHEYMLGPRRTRGDLADLFPVTVRRLRSPRPTSGGGVAAEPVALLKLPRDPRDNDLLEREAVALRQLPKDGDGRYLPYVPRLIESLRHRDEATGERRVANVVATADGFFSLAEVRAAHPDGVDPRDAAWMWRRLLVALGFSHRAGVLHGAVLPEHVLIHPEQHGLVLVDWCYSVPGCYAGTDPSGRVPAMVDRYAGWYPDEVPGRRRASPATDLAMAARCLLYLMGERAPRRL